MTKLFDTSNDICSARVVYTFVQVSNGLQPSEGSQAGPNSDAMLLRVWLQVPLLGSLACKAGLQAIQHAHLL